MNIVATLIAAGIGAGTVAALSPSPSPSPSPTPQLREWEKTLTPLSRGPFLPMPEGKAEYRLGWAGVTAGESTFRSSRPAPGLSRLVVELRTVGSPRLLWPLDAMALLTSDTAAAHPLRVRQLERYRGRSVVSALEFAPDQVFYSKGRLARPADPAPAGFFTDAAADRERLRALTGGKAKRFRHGDVLDLHSALLFVRGQPLREGETLRLLVFQDRSAYLATIRVIRRERIAVQAGNFPAIRLDLSLAWVDKNLALQPHENFRRASGWISDDRNRLLLKIESDVFIGSVWGELVRFTPSIPLMNR